jgi:hypothetical protein
MSISAFFEYLGALLGNWRWSWGAVRHGDNHLFLRIWDDEKCTVDGNWYMRVTAFEYYAGRNRDLGLQERLRHIELIRQGTLTYMIICKATDPQAAPCSIKCFDQDDLSLCEHLQEHNGSLWLERRESVPAYQIHCEAFPPRSSDSASHGPLMGL